MATRSQAMAQLHLKRVPGMVVDENFHHRLTRLIRTYRFQLSSKPVWWNFRSTQSAIRRVELFGLLGIRREVIMATGASRSPQKGHQKRFVLAAGGSWPKLWVFRLLLPTSSLLPARSGSAIACRPRPGQREST